MKNMVGIELQCPHCGAWNDSIDTNCEGTQCGVLRYLITVSDARRLGMRLNEIKARKEGAFIDSYGWDIPKDTLLDRPF